ncbi:DNA translocase FtsK [Conchiformibius steedae]|uniref:Cell division protein FtsK n=1 Tax=Conchiformibius steedae TaxID=153493 RepID=A0A3P2A7Q1_9NEIS|nr:DNA translocase FtsK [Conchiformibius steedae]RRD90916.1 cell division protein FtsK [Conchiformibius steedae]
MWIFLLMILISAVVFAVLWWLYVRQERDWQQELAAYRQQNGTPVAPAAPEYGMPSEETEAAELPPAPPVAPEPEPAAAPDPLLDAPRRPVRLPLPKPVSEAEARQAAPKQPDPDTMPEWERSLNALQSHAERLPRYTNRKPAPKPLEHLHQAQAPAESAPAPAEARPETNPIPFQLLEPAEQESPEIITLEEATRNLNHGSHHNDDSPAAPAEKTILPPPTALTKPDLEVITLEEALRPRHEEAIAPPQPLPVPPLEGEEIGLEDIMESVRERTLSAVVPAAAPAPAQPAEEMETIGMDEIRASLMRQRQARHHQQMAESPTDSLSIIREDEVLANLAHTDSPINRRRKANRNAPPPPVDTASPFRRSEAKVAQTKKSPNTTRPTHAAPAAHTEQESDAAPAASDDPAAQKTAKKIPVHRRFEGRPAPALPDIEIKAPPIVEQPMNFPEPLLPDFDFSNNTVHDWSSVSGPVRDIVSVPSTPPPTPAAADDSENTPYPLHEEENGDSVLLPPLELLLPPQYNIDAVQTDEQLLENGITIEEKLAEFRVKVKVIDAIAGPVITRYEIEPDVGVRGSSVMNLEKDLARSLGMASIRVLETIPGKNCMGIELPNPQRQMIRLSEIFNSPEFARSPSKLTLALGHDITGAPVVTDLASAPHLLVAGTTGSGKSVGINSMILSMLFKAAPEDVRLIMIDPKMLELSVYEGIPHLLAPVVTDMKLAANALNWCVGEMEKRYRLMSHLGVRNLSGYNTALAEAAARGERIANPFSLNPDEPEPLEKLPFIVVVVDEFADLMMTAGKKIEELIARLAQKARAAGIHLILATQRPSVDVITGLIKANIPTRIAFQVPSKTDSRTILDQMGAENLLGQGDMLFLRAGNSHLLRIHGAFVADSEVHHVVEYLKQTGEPNYIDDILLPESSGELPFGGTGGNEHDPLFDKAVETVLRTQKPTISSIQRHLRIGYNKAATLVEQMEAEGILSPADHTGKRTILARLDNSE